MELCPCKIIRLRKRKHKVHCTNYDFSLHSRSSHLNGEMISQLMSLNDLMQRPEHAGNSDRETLMRQLSSFIQTQQGQQLLSNSNLSVKGSGSCPSRLSIDQKRTEKCQVEVRVVFLKIGEIDTLKEQYSADIYVQSRWREPMLDNFTNENLKTVDYSELWSPLIYIENAISEQKDTTWQIAMLNERGEAFVSERRKIRGVFLEKLELQNFPLDVQDLSITVVSEKPDTEVELIHDKEESSSVNVQTFADEQEWKLYQHVEVTKKSIKFEFATQQRQHSAIQVTCRAARRPGYFYYNVFLVMVS